MNGIRVFLFTMLGLFVLQSTALGDPPSDEQLRTVRPDVSVDKDATAGLRPIPLSTKRETQIVDAVFARFPDVDPTEVLAYMRTHFPHEVGYFTALSMRDVDRSVEYLSGIVRDCADLMRARKNDPKRYEQLLRYQKLETKAYDQADALRRASPEETNVKRAEVVETLGACFEIKQELMRQELTKMEVELSSLRELIEKREKNKNFIIKGRTEQITGESDPLRW
ncbi:MAG: hypothetical protein OSB41_13970 [Kiritimatiellae bacterium]|nr:hypothetical protein [Kiritimatiellia bacterium]